MTSRTRRVKHNKHAGKEVVKTIIRWALKEEADKEDWRIGGGLDVLRIVEKFRDSRVIEGRCRGWREKTVEVRIKRAKNDQHGEVGLFS